MEGAGRIESIFYHRRRDGEDLVVEPFVVVREYTSLSKEHSVLDPFRAVEGLNTTIYYNVLDSTPRIISANDLVAHGASMVYTPKDIGKECIMIRSLDRVGVLAGSTNC